MLFVQTRETNSSKLYLLSLFGVGIMDLFLWWQFNILCSFADICKQRTLSSLRKRPVVVNYFFSCPLLWKWLLGTSILQIVVSLLF
jgi:hypothetical protein